MKITAILPFPVWVGTRNQMLVKVETDEGLFGWGESGLSGRERAVLGAVEHYREWLIGRDPMRIGALWQEMYRSQYFEGGRVLQAAGGLLLLYLAWTGFRQWRRTPATGPIADDASAPRTLLQAATVNILNPNPYLGWSLVLGPAALRAWEQSPAHAAALIVAFYATMVAALACTIALLGTTRFLGPRGRRGLVLVSAVTLAVLGAYQLGAGLLRIGSA